MELNENEKTNNNENNNDTGDVNNKSVFVSGIPYSTTEDDLKTMFEKCGTIKSIKVPKYQDTGRNLGYAHIVFQKNKEAQKALELNGTYIGQRYLKVEFSKGEKDEKASRKADSQEIPDGCKTVFIKNLPYDITEQELGDKFTNCGEIKSIRFVYNSLHHHFKGFAYIEFDDTQSVLKALKLHGKTIKDRKMIVDFEESGAKQGYKFRSEKPSKYNKEYQDIVKTSLRKKRKRGSEHK